MSRYRIVALFTLLVGVLALGIACHDSANRAVGANFPSQTPISGDCTSSLDASTSLTCARGTGFDGSYSLPSKIVSFQPTPGAGLTQEVETTSTDAGGNSATMTFPIPVGTNGRVTFDIEGKQVSDGGHQLGGDSTWFCGVINNAGTCQTYRACAAVNAWVATDGGNAWTTSVAVTSCVATVTVTGAAAMGPIHWASTVKFNSAK
jgi:hypothetical protein